MRRNAPAVEEDEGGAGALHAEIGGGRAVIAALGTGDDVGIRREIVEAVAVNV